MPKKKKNTFKKNQLKTPLTFMVVGGISLIVLIVTWFLFSSTTTNLTNNLPKTAEMNEHLKKLQENIAAFAKYKPTPEEIKKVYKLEENGSVYYFASDGKRYIFPTPETYKSWYGDIEPTQTMPLEEMQKIPLGGNVTIKPGSLISTPTDFNIYLVQKGGIIHPVDPAILRAIYGEDFKDRVLSLPNYYFTNYTYGEKISSIEDYPITIITLTIDQDKGFDD